MIDAGEKIARESESEFEDRTRYYTLKEIEEGYGLAIPTRYNPDNASLDKFGLDISYTFSSGTRPNEFITADGTAIKYGADDMTYRRLYIILCECFNGGVLFVDTYFSTLFKQHMGHKAKKITRKVKKSFEEYSALYDAALAAAKWRKDGEMKKSSRGYRLYEALKSWKPVNVKSELRDFSLEVKDDLKQCLATGILPLSFHVSSTATIALRERLGFTPITAFYAFGSLIDHITIYFKVALDDGK